MSPISKLLLERPLDKRRKNTVKKPRLEPKKPRVIAAIPDMRERFVLEYVRGAMAGRPNASEAARIAGYSEKTAGQIAHELLKDVEIREAICRLGMEAAKGIEYDGDMIKRELAAIAFAPITPGFVRASDKKAALELLGVNLKLWEGSKGDKVININILALDLKTL